MLQKRLRVTDVMGGYVGGWLNDMPTVMGRLPSRDGWRKIYGGILRNRRGLYGDTDPSANETALKDPQLRA